MLCVHVIWHLIEIRLSIYLKTRHLGYQDLLCFKSRSFKIVCTFYVVYFVYVCVKLNMSMIWNGLVGGRSKNRGFFDSVIRGHYFPNFVLY